MAFLLPPLARGERRRAPLDLARQRQRRAPDLVERPAPLDAHVDVHAARARRLRPARRGRDRRASRAPRRRPRESAATPRPAPDRDRRAARRDGRDRRRAPGAGAARGTRGWPSTRARPASRGTTSSAVRPDGNCSVDDLDPRRPRLRRALLEEELAADAVRIAHEHVRPAAGALQRALAPPRGSSARGRAWCGPPAGTAPCEGSRSRPRARQR